MSNATLAPTDVAFMFEVRSYLFRVVSRIPLLEDDRDGSFGTRFNLHYSNFYLIKNLDEHRIYIFWKQRALVHGSGATYGLYR